MSASGYPREEFKLKRGFRMPNRGRRTLRKELERNPASRLTISQTERGGGSRRGPTECECQHGTHLNSTDDYPEIQNPKTSSRCPGQLGELCFTHLTKEGMPLLRYRTHDLPPHALRQMQCGRTFVRMDRILGRCDDMLIIRGVNVFPTQIEAVILSLKGLNPHYQPHRGT